MKKLTLLLIVLSLVTANMLKADDFEKAILKAKKNLQAATNAYDEKALIKVRGEFERILQLKKHDWIVNYYLAYIDYSIAFSYMGGKNADNEKVKKFNESALALLDKSILVRDDFADSYVLRLAANFNRWVYEQDKMADIIAQSDEAKKKAETLDPNNPRLHFMNGMSAFYTPSAFGGGMDKAIPLFEKSYEIFKTRVEKEPYYPDWGKDLTYGFLAIAYEKRDDDGDKEKAKKIYEEGLKEFPDSGFLKNYVKSQLEEKK